MRFIISLFVCTFFFPSFSYAQSYLWSISAFSVSATGSSPASACQNWVASYGGGSVYSRVAKASDTHFICYHKTSKEFVVGSVNRSGDSCSDPEATYDNETGECISPEEPENPCEDKAGDSEDYSKSGSRGDGYYDTVNVGGKNYGVTPDSACLGGCAVNVNQKCVFSISANRYSCIGKAYFTGATCVASPSTVVESAPNPTDIEPEVTNDEEPCVYVQDGEGRSHCVSKQSVEQEGQNCGTAGPSGSEQVKCYPKEAKKDESKIETEVTEKPTPDGGKETVKKDVHTETKCTGNNQNCTTTTTTTTTTTKSDGSGKTTSTVVTCKGPKCGDDGKGGSGGGGGGGSGDGDGEEEGGGNLPGNDDVPGFGDSLGSFTSKIQGSPIVGAVGAISFPDGGSCNMPSASVYMLGTISFDWFCQNANILDALYYVMLGVWALGAVRLFLEA